jgi:pre-mRNA-splicing factor ATP-dependent RNA helicase DHX16
VPMLREVSRQEYLKKREEKKIQELEDELLDAKYLFEGVELTARERADLQYKEQVLLLVGKRTSSLSVTISMTEAEPNHTHFTS